MNRNQARELLEKYFSVNFFGPLLKAISERRQQSGGEFHRGHGSDHDLLVGQFALLIADNEIDGMLAWVAAHLHSLDRILGAEAPVQIRELLENYTQACLSAEQIDLIYDAVIRHDTPNNPDDSVVKVLLQDADRLANVGSMVVARSGQFRPDLPVIELGYTGLTRHPDSTYHKPRSIKDDLLGCLEWDAEGEWCDPKFCLRTAKAIELGRPRFQALKMVLASWAEDFEITGLDPWPITQA